MGTVIAVTAVPAESLATSRIPAVHIVAVLAEGPRAPAAQQTQRGDDRVERIRVLGIVRHAPILHAT